MDVSNLANEVEWFLKEHSYFIYLLTNITKNSISLHTRHLSLYYRTHMHTIRMTLWIWFNPSVNLGKTYVLELLWTVYSEEKLHSFLELTNFQNHFNKDKSVKYFSSLAAVKIGKKRVGTLFFHWLQNAKTLKLKCPFFSHFM